MIVAATALVLAWGALAFGSVYSWAFWPLATAAAVTGIAGLSANAVRGLRERRQGAPADSPERGGDGRADAPAPRLSSAALVACLVIVAGAVLVQVAPLPVDRLAQLSPRTPDALGRLDLSFAAGLTTHHALSIAPAATLTALALFAAFAVLMLGTARAATLHGARGFATAVCLLGVLVALVGIVQRPFYAGKIYGFWAPLMPNSRPFGPFVNPNHFAGWMLMALPLTFGLLCAAVARGMRGVPPDWRHRLIWLSSREASHAILVGAAAIVMAVSLVLTMSRSGMLAFAMSVAITSWFAIRRLPARSKQVLVAAYLACIVVITVGCVGGDAIAARFASANPYNVNERLPIWRDTWRIVGDFWLTGTGLNTYGVATLLYQTAMPELHLREAHNDYLQVLAEGGLLLSLPVACALIVFAKDVRGRFRESRGSAYWLRLGAVTGLIAIALQSTVEFSLQMPGNAVLFAVLCGIALHHPRR